MDSKKTLNKAVFYKQAEFWNNIFIEILFYLYVLFINDYVLKMLYNIPITNHLGKIEVKANMPNQTLAIIILLFFILEIYGFIKLNAAKHNKIVVILLSAIPRLFLFWEISRMLLISFAQKITTATSILLFFLVPVLLIMSFVIFSMAKVKTNDEKKLANNTFDFNLFFTFPFFCLWFTLFEKVYLFDWWNGSWFVFIGLYSIFMYFPLKLPRLIANIGNKDLKKWQIILLIIQPIFAYIMVYKSMVK